MTFTIAEAALRERIVGETQPDFFGTVSLTNRLIEASIEIAAAFKFPQGIASILVPAGAKTLSPPTDFLSTEIGQFMIGNYRAKPTDWATVAFKQNTLPAGPVESYNWDHRRPGTIHFAPQSIVEATANFEYTKRLYVSGGNYVAPTGPSEIWGTVLTAGNWTTPVYPQYHHLVLFLAGVYAFDMSQEYDKSDYYRKAYREKIMDFGAFLGMTDVANMMVEKVNRRDAGTGVN